MRASNSLGPMWCAPHIEGQYLRDQITSIVLFAHKASNPGARDWFNQVYELLDKHEIPKDWRAQFYTHAQGVHQCLHTTPESSRNQESPPSSPSQS